MMEMFAKVVYKKVQFMWMKTQLLVASRATNIILFLVMWFMTRLPPRQAEYVRLIISIKNDLM